MDGTEVWSGGIRLIPAAGVFPLGTDAVLLAAFTGVSGVHRMLDLGCGSGVLSLLLAARAPRAQGRGLDISPAAVENARQNAALNGLEARLTFETADLRAFRTLGGAGAYDLVTANPPYFPVESGFAATCRDSDARQEQTCTLEQVCAAAGYFTRWGGRFALVHRPERLAEIIRELSRAGLEAKRMQFVQPRADSAPNLVLIEARRGAKPGLSILAPLVLYEADGGESAQLRQIYHRD